MSQFVKKSAGKRGKPTYAYAIIGVALVLFLFGIVGWFFLNLRKTGDYFKESIQVHAFLSPTAAKKQIDSLTTFISAMPYANRVQYVTKEMALKNYTTENDSSWKMIIDANPLPESIDFYVKADYVEEDSLNNLAALLQTTYPGVITDFQFPTETVTKVSSYVKTAGIVFLIVAVLLTVLVVFSIDNTIRLAMYSNRFLIKTMQMVGATRGFITKPINQRAVINGLISAGIAIAAVWGSVIVLENMIPGFQSLHDTQGVLVLFLIIIVIGVTISLVSTHRSVIKYLRMKLDDLY
ncbi:MAG TPA: permease-like cell division protein FtsX [Ferruginibacter sp.]|nr:permease-like cell division protein FtsX [Ferruginibacter sp.]